MFDRGFFKRLAHNDTGAARGHQGGIVVPKDLARFFPPLPTATSELRPTVDVRLYADLIVDGVWVATVETRYQHQTWGGTRRAERRLTDNLGPLRNLATADDILIFSRDLDSDARIRLDLVRKQSPEFSALSDGLGVRRWGALDLSDPPATLAEIDDADARIDQQLSGAPEVFSDERQAWQVSTIRRARDRAFRQRLLQEYGFRCTFSDQSFADPRTKATYGLDAAHIVPVHANGSDDPANGLLLSKDLHWAFDRGMIGVAEDRRIIVAKSAQDIVGNAHLSSFHGRPMREAQSIRARPQEDALAWHRENVLLT